MSRSSLPRSFPAFACALLVTAALAPTALHAQDKRPLTHDDYDDWKSLGSRAFSPDGKWVAYAVSPQWGDGELVVRQTEGDTVYRHALGTRPAFSIDGRYVVFGIEESKVEERRKRLKELHEKGRVGASSEESSESGRGFRGRGGARRGGGNDVGVMNLNDGSVEVVKRVKSFRVLEDLPVLVYHLDKPEEKKDEEKKEGEKAEEKEGEKTEAGEKKAEASAAAAEPTSERQGRREGGRSRAGARGAGRGPDREEKDPLDRFRKEGTDLVLRDLSTGDERRWPDVASYGLTGEQTWLYMHVSQKKAKPKRAARGDTADDSGEAQPAAEAETATPVTEYGLYAVKCAGGDRIALLKGIADFAGFATDRGETVFAFTSNLEEVKAIAARHAEKQQKAKEGEEGESEKGEEPAEKTASAEEGSGGDEEADDDTKHEIWLWDMTAAPARKVVHAQTAGMPPDKEIGTGLSFSKDGSVLQFSVREPKDELPKILPEEKVVLDVWSWNDGLIQPAQARRRGRSGDSFTAVWHRDEDRVVVLGDEQIPSMSLITPDGSRALATDGKPYEKLITWDGSYDDVYLVNTIDGTRKKVLERLRSGVRPSPSGKYLVYFDDDYHWQSIEVATLKKHDLTGGLGVAFDNQEDDHPHPNPSYGIAGWTPDDRAVVIYDEFDLWKIDPADGSATCLTDGMGRTNHIRFRWMRIDLDEEMDEEERNRIPETMWLSATDTETMDEGVYEDSSVEVRKPRRLFWVPKSVGGISKARKADRLLLTLETFAEFPDLWTSKLDFSSMRKLSEANPQQKGIRWGTAELVRWHNGDGDELKGILIKPDGFDPSKKYPMMVYFYEKLSSQLHRYTRPSPGTSPNAAYYVSNGYLWFMPDIVYEVGYPGDSCRKCVVSGVQSLIAKGFVDEKAIGAAGHSWGGYQTAYLVTRTDIFAAVESGAPVSNMFSAYGGIRYGSGMSRQFQYEMTQSRIGGTPWQYPMRYWENSPIFFADKVHTPVLILHNDQDGAVPWTNGIEYFMALRRLDKESYLFNYVGEDHGLGKRQNQKDWTRRMAQYFDHHLRGQPAPKWMTEGVPYDERDREKLQWVPSLLEASVSAPPVAAPTPAAASSEASSGAGSGGNDR